MSALWRTILFLLKLVLYPITIFLWPSEPGEPWNNASFWEPDRGRRPVEKGMPKYLARSRTFWLDHASPFLLSKGYYLYAPVDADTLYLKRTRPPAPPHKQYAQQVLRDDEDAQFTFHSRVWAAQDGEGRDVVIKFMPNNRYGRMELRVNELLNSAPLRDDPRHTPLPTIERIPFGGGVFMVWPRWGPCIHPDYASVGDVVRFARRMLETLVFFHENNITHGDLCEGNILTNVVVPHFVISGHRVAGLRGPERLYAFTDFETCVVDTDSIWRFTDTFVERAWRDVFRVAEVLQAPFHRICAEGFDPALLMLLGKMQSLWRPPTAAEALARFNEICAPLTNADLDVAITSIAWYNGKLYPREKPIMYSLPPRES
ncbi:40S ribosomal protein S0 [Mycena kentingensis (nom. inval.)]|nr:40S ribosomal protein S0 [Mycena kentingensis (nom. inval.)]